MLKVKKNHPKEDAQKILDSIRRIVKTIRHSSKETERKMGLSAAQLYVLDKIAESARPLSINDLAARTLTHQSSVSVVVAKLVKQKLVDRSLSKKDARSVELSLNSRGESLLKGRPPLIQERLLDAIYEMSPKGRKSLVAGLQDLIKRAGLEAVEPSLFFEEKKGN